MYLRYPGAHPRKIRRSKGWILPKTASNWPGFAAWHDRFQSVPSDLPSAWEWRGCPLVRSVHMTSLTEVYVMC
jgi:hypothetical protein